jgi:hypothetical protein
MSVGLLYDAKIGIAAMTGKGKKKHNRQVCYNGGGCVTSIMQNLKIHFCRITASVAAKFVQLIYKCRRCE